MDILQNYNSFRDEVVKFNSLIRKRNSVQIKSKLCKNKGKILIKEYFHKIRPEISKSLSEDSLLKVDKSFQDLLSFTNADSLKSKYLSTIRSLKKELDQIEMQLTSRLTGEQGNQKDINAEFTNFEKSVLSTLEQFPCGAHLSYKQVLFDLNDEKRVSYKGTANEIRETLRETLNHLAPDEEVKSQSGFKLEKDRKKPTQKQKVSFILKQRNKSKKYIKVPIEATEIIDNSKGNLIRAIYDRSSVSAHSGTAKGEVIQLKQYLDCVLSELLELHQM